jgi:hypothetical protein
MPSPAKGDCGFVSADGVEGVDPAEPADDSPPLASGFDF